MSISSESRHHSESAASAAVVAGAAVVLAAVVAGAAVVLAAVVAGAAKVVSAPPLPHAANTMVNADRNPATRIRYSSVLCLPRTITAAMAAPDQPAVMPPSTGRAVPVMNCASAEAKNRTAAATSCG